MELYKDFRNSGAEYPEKHNENYETIESTVNTLESKVAGLMGGSQGGISEGLKEILDRRGITGPADYQPQAGTLTGPNYNLTVLAGGYYDGGTFRRKTTSTLLPMVGFSTATYYVNIDSAGNPSVSATPTTETAWQFDYNATTHVVSNVARYTGVAILFSGDDFADMLTSAAKSTTYEKVADRLEAIEQGQDVFGSYYAQDLPHSGLNFKYKAGKVRNDSAIYDTTAGQVALTDNTTNYVELDPTDGSVDVNTTGFTSGKIPLYQVVTASGAISTVTDKRTPAIAGTGGGGGGHTQNTDTGTTATKFGIDTDATGNPTGQAGIEIENGDDPNVIIGHNRDTGEPGWSPDGGTTWKPFFDPSGALSGQEITKVVKLAQPPQVHSEAGRGSSTGWEEIDLSSYLTEAVYGTEIVWLRVFFKDSAPGSLVFVEFQKKGGPQEGVPQRVWSGDLDPAVIMVEPDSAGKIEFAVYASGSDTADLDIYLISYAAKVPGVGTQEKTLTKTGIAVPAASNVTLNYTGWLNRGLVHYLKIEETGGLMTGTYDLEIYGKDTFLAADLMYKATGINPASAFEDWLPWWYKDKDGTSELHVKIINNDGSNAGTFSLTLEAEQFA